MKKISEKLSISLFKIISSNNNFKTFDKIKDLRDLYFN